MDLLKKVTGQDILRYILTIALCIYVSFYFPRWVAFTMLILTWLLVEFQALIIRYMRETSQIATDKIKEILKKLSAIGLDGEVDHQKDCSIRLSRIQD